MGTSRTLFVAGAAAGCLLMASGAVAQASTPQARPSAGRVSCDVAALQRLVSSSATIVTARRLVTPATHTPYCRVDGTVATSGPTGPNTVNFQVSLPDTFTNRYLFIGVGSAAGVVPDPDEQQLKEGWAQAGTDARGPGSLADFTFAVNRTKALDWSSRGVHLTTGVTQAITRAYYGQPRKLYRYLSGCSGGGRMGRVEAAQFPTDYDGILAGAPGANNLNILKFGQIVDHLLRKPESWVSPAQLQQLETAVVKTYDAADGATDGLVRDPSVIDTGNFGELGIFNPAQLTTIRLITSDLTVGQRIYKGYSASNPTGWAAFLTGTTPPATWASAPPAAFILFDTNTRAMFGLNYDFRTQMNFDNPADLQRWVSTFVEVFPGQEPTPDDFDAFQARGGKMVIWHGVSDNGISLADNLRQYQQLAQHEGGYAAAQKSTRFFTVPGLLHCAGGPGPQDTPTEGLAALANWVEHGQAPGNIVVHSAANQPAASFRLCPVPSKPVFKGGNPLDATAWGCRG
ncbi:tannase/feruloyl esterase family alpha/beta hydrolase [Cryptosporangium aurantiacum]|uniref:Feruloyl esterase n=1 Tax=Cryptosporangium aurantiacum TaxID=134849 RepID=A0A1M7PQE7_9ACTN|nr:tannase/feruloyl esterase family alpha/beta hydrolase [Cryptosporangium aurantiacum]SHN19568.1 feruloyl esterase [Cryptosporangium aurantiacum]